MSFLISLREDSLAKLDRFKGRISTLWDSNRRVDHLDRTAAEDAIRRPLLEYNARHAAGAPVTIEDDLVKAVLSQVQTESFQFEVSGSGTVGSRHGVEGTHRDPISATGDDAAVGAGAGRGKCRLADGHARVGERRGGDCADAPGSRDAAVQLERDVAARVFHRLVTPSGAKIAFSVSDLAAYDATDPQMLSSILSRLEEGSRRILRRVASRTDVVEEPRYEIFHDRLGQAFLS